MTKALNWLDLGLISYDEAFTIQENLHHQCVQKNIHDILLFQECYPIITLGRNSHEKNLLYSNEELKLMGIKITTVSRGGDISYHGNGQLIVSPILHFNTYIDTAHHYVRCLEQIIINLLETYSIKGFRIKGRSGVWVIEPHTDEEKKIAAIGIAISHQVTFHGISININPNLNHFSTIIPCGIHDKGVTSIKACGILPPSIKAARNQFILCFNEMFDTVTTRKSTT
jgi:lipoate-protein ligase B